MQRSPLIPALLAAVLLAGPVAVHAQTAAQPPTNPATPSPPPPKRPRAVSPEVAASLAAAMPKYNPPKPVEKKPEEELPDARDVDKPKNGIVRLPQYIVREPRAPIFRERDINTPENLGEIARRRYLSELDRGVLNRWSFLGVQSILAPDATTSRALDMYAEEERLKNMTDLKDDAGLVSARDKAAGAYIKREAQKMYQRTDDFGWRNNNSR